MGDLTRKFLGFAFVGGTYQSIKKTLNSDSVVGSGFYSGLAGLLAIGACRLLNAERLRDRLEELLSNENPQVAKLAREKLVEFFPGRVNREAPQDENEQYRVLQSYKEQLKRERGY